MLLYNLCLFSNSKNVRREVPYEHLSHKTREIRVKNMGCKAKRHFTLHPSHFTLPSEAKAVRVRKIAFSN